MLKIQTVLDRISTQTGVKMAIFGPFGIGKTSLLKTLEKPTLCLDFEAGLLSVPDWKGDLISIRTWDDARDIACLIGGFDPSMPSSEAYSRSHYAEVKARYPTLVELKPECIFIDSVTIASKLCLRWAKEKPECISDRTGRFDLRAAYGILANEMLSWINHFQHMAAVDVIFVGLLEKKTDGWKIQTEGRQTSAYLPGIVDEVISMVSITKDNKQNRVFVCRTMNEFDYPAKDRSGRLKTYEEPNLGNILKKIRG